MAWLDDAQWWLSKAERWRPRVVEPLRLRAWLYSPIEWDGYYGITLEGALQAAVIWRETKRPPSDVFAGFDGAVDIPIPIEHITIEGESIACASWAIPPPIAIESVRWVRKRARAEALNLGKVLIAGGPYKSLNIPHATLATPYLDFYVRGDRELLADLLPDACAIGKGNSIGFGTVYGWDVERDEADRSVWHRGAPQRALPAAVVGDCREGTYQVREGTLRAPYWVRHSRTNAVHPHGPFGAPSPE